MIRTFTKLTRQLQAGTIAKVGWNLSHLDLTQDGIVS